MKLISLVNELMSEGLNLPKKVKPIYSYQKKCYKDGDPHGWHEMSNDDECHWAKWLHDELNLIVEKIPQHFSIKDIHMFDKYQGPYAFVLINEKQYRIWTTQKDGLWIEDYPIDNTSNRGENLNPGFDGTWLEIVEVIEHPELFETE